MGLIVKFLELGRQATLIIHVSERLIFKGTDALAARDDNEYARLATIWLLEVVKPAQWRSENLNSG